MADMKLIPAGTKNPQPPQAPRKAEVGASSNRSWPYDLDPPPEFHIDPATLTSEKQLIAFLQSFDRWPSDLWIRYAQTYGKDGVLAIPPKGRPERTIVISATEAETVFVIERMNAMDFAALSHVDQMRVAATAAFDELKAAFGFERSADARFDGLSFNDYVDRTIGDMRWQQGDMPDADLQPYLDQLRHMRDQVNRQEILNPAAILKKIKDIKDAFSRAARFASVQPQTFEGDHYSNVISLDDGAAVSRGYRVFIESDRQIAAAETKLSELLQQARNLDPAMMVIEILRLDQAITNAKSTRESQELEQQNELAKTYAAMQDAVNETLRLFGEEKEGETKRFTLYGKANYAELTGRQKKVVSMFSTLFGKTSQRHPLEEARSVERPLMDLVDNKDGYPLMTYTNSQWNTFGTQLSEVVTLLGQNTQLKMNDINTLQQQSTSQFEAVAKTLSRMSEIISAISRNT